MKLVLVISSLAGGGAERFLVELARHLSAQDHEVAVVTTRGGGADVYSLPHSVHRESLGYEGIRWYQLARRLRLMTELRDTVTGLEPDLILSFMVKTNLTASASLIGDPVPLVLAERSAPQRDDSSLVIRTLRRLLYRRARAVAVLTHGARDYFRAFLPEHTVSVIPNPLMGHGCEHVQPVDVRALFPRNPSIRRFICSVGRLARVKGFDALRRVFAPVHEKNADCGLVLLGEGSQRSELERLAGSLGIQDSVLMPGRVEDTAPYLASAEVFACTSRFEGFGNAIVEAMACGVPVVSFDCPNGPGEIITDAENGCLVPPNDERAFEDKLEELLNDPGLRRSLSERGRSRSADFTVDRVMGSWSKLILRAARPSRSRARNEDGDK